MMSHLYREEEEHGTTTSATNHDEHAGEGEESGKPATPACQRKRVSKKAGNAR